MRRGKGERGKRGETGKGEGLRKEMRQEKGERYIDRNSGER